MVPRRISNNLKKRIHARHVITAPRPGRRHRQSGFDHVGFPFPTQSVIRPKVNQYTGWGEARQVSWHVEFGHTGPESISELDTLQKELKLKVIHAAKKDPQRLTSETKVRRT